MRMYVTDYYSPQYSNSANAIGNILAAGIIQFIIIWSLLALLIGAFSIFCMWKLFEKAGKPGWAALIPIYNLWILFETAELEGILSLLALVPFVGYIAIGIISIIAWYKISGLFGKSDGFAIGLILLNIVFLPILIFDNKATYKPLGKK